MGTEMFPDANAPLLRVRLRAPAGTRIEETERIVLRALDVIEREAGRDNVAITSDFVGVGAVQLSGGPDSSVHQRTAGSDHPGGRETRRSARRGAARTDPRAACSASLPDMPGFFRSRRHRYPGDELRIAHSRRGGRAGRQPAGRLRVRAEGPDANGEAALPARPAIRAGDELSRRSTSTSIANVPASSA